MENDYNFKKIEKKWQERWANSDYGKAKDDDSKPKHYHLVEFPYPSGSGLHVGHCMGYGASDAYSRMKRMQGFNVLYPMGWDAFGLPTENYAIKTGIHPKEATKQNVEVFRRQMKSLGYSFDWDREVNTTDPNYYKWTQWIFLQFYKHAVVDGKLIKVADDDKKTPRLAFQQEMPINWCGSCKTGLANEEVISGKCERCGEEVIKKMQKQWMLRITAYADRLIDDLDTVEYLDKIKTQQVNWIGRSNGANIKFSVIPDSIRNPENNELDPRVPPQADKQSEDDNNVLEVFTTRPDTLYGATFMVLAPEHSIINNLKEKITNFSEVQKYIDSAKKKSDLERTDLNKDKNGVKIKGINAINPINNKEIPIFIADYVLSTYGTGAIMAVPAHDERDYEFAKKYGIKIIDVIIPSVTDKVNPPKEGVKTVFRNAIQAIVINPKDKKVLMLKWKKHPWTTFITGGIDDDEDPVKAAEREVLEETGYKNIRFVKKLGGPVDSNFYADHKGVNRKAHFSGIVFELKDEKREDVSDEEKAIHNVAWMSWEEIKNDKNLTCAEYEIWLDRFHNDKYLYLDHGIMINSDEFDGMESKDAFSKIVEKLEKNNSGNITKNYKLRDWIFSRQHYWGEPIPIIYCRKCWENSNLKSQISKSMNCSIINGKEHIIVSVPEDQLPLKLPEVEKYEPTNNGESPLANVTDWVNVKCPKCKGDAKRETDTMPNWAGSSWYYLRYTDPKNDNEFANKDKMKKWTPVDIYNGGMEHTTLHLLYSRFWHKFLYDMNLVPTLEPYQKRIAHGIILGSDNRKMSKSFGNVINPDEIVKDFGADTLRAYMMFIGPYDQESAWNQNGVLGVHRFLKKVWGNFQKQTKPAGSIYEIEVLMSKYTESITHDLEKFHLNTYIAKLMEINNHLSHLSEINANTLSTYTKLLYPAVPHLAEELWERLGEKKPIYKSNWPVADKKLLEDKKVTIAIQINGKVRDMIEIENNTNEESLKKQVLDREKVKTWIQNKEIVKTIIVPNKIISIVVK